MTPQPQQHCDHECVCPLYEGMGMNDDGCPMNGHPMNPCKDDTRSRPHTSTPPVPNSHELSEMAKTEWANREERRGIHNKEDWCTGWISGFLTPNKPDWQKECSTAIRNATLHDLELLVRESMVKGGTTIKLRFTRKELLSMFEQLRTRQEHL